MKCEMFKVGIKCENEADFFSTRFSHKVDGGFSIIYTPSCDKCCNIYRGTVPLEDGLYRWISQMAKEIHEV